MPRINPILAFMSKYRDSSPYFAETLTVLRMHAKALRISDRQLPQGCAFPGKPMETGGIIALAQPASRCAWAQGCLGGEGGLSSERGHFCMYMLRECSTSRADAKRHEWIPIHDT